MPESAGAPVGRRRIVEAVGRVRRGPVAYPQDTEPSGLPMREQAMADKSPRQHLAKKAGKSLKEKRADKHAKADAKDHISIVPPS